MMNFSTRSLTKKNSEQKTSYKKAKEYSMKHAKKRIRLQQKHEKSTSCKTDANSGTTRYNVKNREKVTELM